MQPRCLLAAFALSCVVIFAPATPSPAAPVMSTEAWDNNNAGFAALTKRVLAMSPRNLLVREEAQMLVDQRSRVQDANALADGDTGVPGGDGRAMPEGNPAVINFYLGRPKTVTEIGAFTYNGDTRANQVFEVRLANNACSPGVMPAFSEKAQFTTGDLVLGRDSGGFHCRFRDDQGGPLLAGKVDWVQFRIWGTSGIRTGLASRTARAPASAYVELEVLGEASDIVRPPAEVVDYQKAFEKAPKQPEFVKKATWQETLIANREALAQWESIHDGLTLGKAHAVMGPWHLLGPLGPKSKDLASLRSAKKIDFDARYDDGNGRKIGWQKCEQMKDGQLNDLTGYAGAARDAVFFLCRDVGFRRPIVVREVYMDLAVDNGSATWLLERQGPGVQSTLPVIRGGTNMLHDSAPRQLLLELNAGAEGQRRFCFALRPNLQRPGAGSLDTRRNVRRQLYDQVRAKFAAPADQLEMRWDVEGDVWGFEEQRSYEDWAPGRIEEYLKTKYREALARRLQAMDALLAEQTGVTAIAMAESKERFQAWVDRLRKSPAAPDLASSRARYYQAAAVREAIDLAARLCSMRLAVEDLRESFKEQYPKAGAYLGRIAGLKNNLSGLWGQLLAEVPGNEPAKGDSPIFSARKLGQSPAQKLGQSPSPGRDRLVAMKGQIDAAQAEILLDNPLLAFDKLLLTKGPIHFSSNWDGPNHIGDAIVILSPVRADGNITTIYSGTISNIDLHWDGRRILFSDRNTLWEINADGTGKRRVSAEEPPVNHYDSCYLPNGQIACVSNACEQAVPCTGGGGVGNMHLMNADGTGEHRITFDQDHNWNPVVMNDGRVLYSRWEYTDLPHYFSRMLFRMNPDGSGQMEYYHSGSFWPNATYWPRPIPGQPTMISCVVSGHHGVSRVGEMVILDPARGRQEADGAIQKIPGYGKKVEPTMLDQLVTNSWPKFAAPYPLAEPGTNRGAGKYFLCCLQRDAHSTYELCLVDVFDNLTTILSGGYMSPIPLRPRPMPPVIPSHLDPKRTDGLIYLADVYQGDGLRGYPRGSIKTLRIGSHHYRYAGNGDTYASSMEGGWDIKKILGTVPVHEDGSALFRVPANTPIFVQPLDADGKAQQVMRSWYTAIPGETASCIGCHEKQNSGPPSKYTAAAMGRPSEIQPWNGPTRGFSFDREVQPVLDHRCAGCHNGQPYHNGGHEFAVSDLRAKQLRPEYTGNYSPAYLELQKYVRRPGYESTMHMHVPAEFEADTSALVQMLKKGHYNVQLDRDEWDRLYTWIDLNVPYPANWRESHRPPQDEQVATRVKYKKLFAGIDDRDEESPPLPPIARFEPPKAAAPRGADLVKLDRWPLGADEARSLQKAAGSPELEIDLGGAVKMKLVPIPAGRFVMGSVQGFADETPLAAVAIDRPFCLGQMEVTNAQYAQFDAKHASGFIEGRGKDRVNPGTPIGGPDLPVVRVSWNEAMAFCEWLSQKTGRHCTLPTEAQWEWACRAGTATPFAFGEFKPGSGPVANVADGSIAGWNYGRSEPGYNDGAAYSVAGGRYAPNAWGLCDMHGNVAEWCLSTYRPYPYQPEDGRDNPQAPGPKVVRGGSWNDTMKYATSASRWRYQPYQPVYNVGFRVLVELKAGPAVASASKSANK